MKTNFLTFGLISVFTLTSLAQSKQKTTTTSSSSSYYSTSVHKDEFSNSNSTVSISNSNGSYKFRANFNKLKTDYIKKVLLVKLANENLEINGKTHLWAKNINGDEVFKCKLTKGRVKIYLDKDEVSTNFYDEIYTLGEELKTLISGEDSKEDNLNTVKSARKELEKAQRSLAHAERELERAKSKVN